MTLELQATPQEVMRAVELVQELGKQRQLCQRDIFALALTLEECASNIVDHAYRRDPRQKFRLIVEFTPAAVTIELRDHGPEFDPTHQLAQQNVEALSERSAGGRGLLLVQHYADELLYHREPTENVLRLTKRLSAPGSEP